MNIEFDTTNVLIVLIVLAILYFLYDCYCKHENFEYQEPKFPPKEFVMIKKQFPLNKKQREQREAKLVWDSPYERNIGEWMHREGDHGPRNTGFSPKYHDQKVVQYLPSWPNVTDNFEVIEEIPADMLANPTEDSPVLETSAKVDIDKILY